MPTTEHGRRRLLGASLALAALAATALAGASASASVGVAMESSLPATAAPPLASAGAPAAPPSAAGAPAAPPASPSVPSTRPGATGVAWTQRLITAGGVTQWIQCGGRGRVTVVVIPGLHATHTMWSKVLPAFAQTTRTCIVDRAGLGASPARHPHRTVDAGLHANELWAVLNKAGVHGPLIVVGHSYGGLIARAFVARHRSSVVGLMLVEGVAPYDRLSRYWAEGGDRVDTWASSKAALPMRLGSMPLVVESAQDPDRSYWGGPAYGGSASDIADWKAHQLSASLLSTDGSFVIVRHSAHVIEHDQPAAVIAGVRLLVTSAVTHRWMPRCALSAFGSQPRCS